MHLLIHMIMQKYDDNAETLIFCILLFLFNGAQFLVKAEKKIDKIPLNMPHVLFNCSCLMLSQ